MTDALYALIGCLRPEDNTKYVMGFIPPSATVLETMQSWITPDGQTSWLGALTMQDLIEQTLQASPQAQVLVFSNIGDLATWICEKSSPSQTSTTTPS